MSVSHNTQSASKRMVNSLLDSVLPGVSSLSTQNKAGANLKSKKQPKKNSIQLINDNLKKKFMVDHINTHSILKKSKLQNKKQIKSKKLKDEWYNTQAKIKLLKEHYQNNKLTKEEESLLKKRIDKQVKILKKWELDEDLQEELEDLQNSILSATEFNKDSSKSRRLKKKSKSIKSGRKSVSSISEGDHQFPGLTPGLAPVGMDDEESSDEGY